MPLGEWYSLTEVCQETQLSYSQVLHWVRRHLRDSPPPLWVQRTTRGFVIHADGLVVLRHEHPQAAARRGG